MIRYITLRAIARITTNIKNFKHYSLKTIGQPTICLAQFLLFLFIQLNCMRSTVWHFSIFRELVFITKLLHFLSSVLLKKHQFVFKLILLELRKTAQKSRRISVCSTHAFDNEWCVLLEKSPCKSEKTEAVDNCTAKWGQGIYVR